VAPPSRAVTEWLQAEGVRRVAVGHQPQGDAPLVLDRYGLQVGAACCFICGSAYK